MVNFEPIDSSVSSKTDDLGYSTHRFQNTSGTRFHLQSTQKYKEVKKCIKKLHIFDNNSMRSKELITYGSLVKEDMDGYRNIFT